MAVSARVASSVGQISAFAIRMVATVIQIDVTIVVYSIMSATTYT